MLRRALKPEFLFYLHRWLNVGGEKEIKHDAHILDETVHKIIRQRNEVFFFGRVVF